MYRRLFQRNNVSWFMDVSLDEMCEKSYKHSKQPIFCPIDKENSPELVKVSDFSPPVFRCYIEDGIKKYNKIREEGKWFFLFKTEPRLPIELWLKILQFKHCHDKYEYLFDILGDDIYLESVSYKNLPEDRKLEIDIREENTRRLMLSECSILRSETSVWSRYYEKDSIMDRLMLDMDELFCRKIEFMDSLENPGDTILNYTLILLKIYKKWFFLLDRGQYLINSTHGRNYNKGKIVSFIEDCEKTKNFLFELVNSEDETFSLLNFLWEDKQIEVAKINQKGMCRLITLDINFLTRVYNIRCPFMDSPPDCPECLCFYYYFYEYSSYKELTFSKCGKDKHFYFNQFWDSLNENGEKLIDELTRKGYYD